MKWAILAIGLFVGGWLVFDGARALVVGQYVTPKSGPHAGQLGPWSGILQRVGIDPRGAGARWLHVVCGALLTVTSIAYWIGAGWAWWGVILGAVLALWYFPFGTLLNVVLILLVLFSRRGAGGAP